MKVSIVTTTINIPTLLERYARNAADYGHSDLDFIVVGDRKSPPETADFCAALPHYPCSWLDIAAQKKYLERFPDLWSHLPFDSIQRRNIGLLLAYENGADLVITIDDDNFILDGDFVSAHALAGTECELPAFSSTSGWFNVCSLLEADGGMEFYHRGYPSQMRWTEGSAFVSSFRSTYKVAINAGFWLDNPDIDALTRMERQPVVRGFNRNWPGENFALAPGVWCPFNSQNTAIMRDALPAYFLSPYVGRYDDIWAGYVLLRIAHHFGHVVSYGHPVVRQERNPHDLWKDLDAERVGMTSTDSFCQALRSLPLSGRTYHACMGEIGAALGDAWQPGPKWTEAQRESRRRVIEGLDIWHGTFEKMAYVVSRPAVEFEPAPARRKPLVRRAGE